MKPISSLFRKILPAALLAGSVFSLPAQEEPGCQLVLRTGRSIPLSAVASQGDNFVVRAPAAGFAEGAVIAGDAISHVSGEKPMALSIGTAQLLMGRAGDAVKTLEPSVDSLRPTSRISGNYWIHTARVLSLAYALNRETAKIEPLVKEISDTTPAQGHDPIDRLAKALSISIASGIDDRVRALNDLISETNPVEISAFASYFKGRLLEENKRNDDALKSYLTVGCLYPSGNVLATSAAELHTGILLSTKEGRRDEAVAILKSALAGAAGTAIGEEAAKRIESLADVGDQPKEPAETGK
jgi:hypothetical protein